MTPAEHEETINTFDDLCDGVISLWRFNRNHFLSEDRVFLLNIIAEANSKFLQTSFDELLPYAWAMEMDE